MDGTSMCVFNEDQPFHQCYTSLYLWGGIQGLRPITDISYLHMGIFLNIQGPCSIVTSGGREGGGEGGSYDWALLFAC